MAYEIHEMFGMLPDLVSQGYSSAEDILSIAETGQPDKNDPYQDFAEKNAVDMMAQDSAGNVYEDMMNITGDANIAALMATEAGNAGVIESVLGAIPLPTWEETALQQAVDQIMALGPAVRDEAINSFSDSFGLDESTVTKEVNSKVKEVEKNTRPWWMTPEDEDDGEITAPLATPTPIDKSPPLTGIDSSIGWTDAMSIESLGGPYDEIGYAPEGRFKENQRKWEEGTIVKDDGFFIDTTGLEPAPPIDINRQVEDLVPTNPITDMVQNLLTSNTAAPFLERAIANRDARAKQDASASALPENPSAINVEGIDKLVGEIESLEAATEAVTPQVATQATQPTVPVSGIKELPVGSPGWNELENQIMNLNRGPNTFQYILDTQIGGIPQHVVVDPRGHQGNIDVPVLYSYYVGTDGINRIFELGPMKKQISSGPYTNFSSDTLGQIFHSYDFGQTRMFEPGKFPETPVASSIPSLPQIDTIATLDTHEEMWDALRASEMGDDIYNPTLWGARRQGFNPAQGRYLLSGGLGDTGQSTSFAEWLPTLYSRDRGDLWKDAVLASNLMSGEAEWANVPEGKRDLMQLLQGQMQGPGARGALTSMAATGLGAGDGYVSSALRNRITDMYDLYSSQMAATGQPVGGFLSYLDNRMGR